MARDGHDSCFTEQTDQDRLSFLNEWKVPGVQPSGPEHGWQPQPRSWCRWGRLSGLRQHQPGQPDEYVSASRPVSPSPKLQNSLQVEFDSSFRPEEAQTVLVDVTYDGGTTWQNLLTYTTDNTGGAGPKAILTSTSR